MDTIEVSGNLTWTVRQEAVESPNEVEEVEAVLEGIVQWEKPIVIVI